MTEVQDELYQLVQTTSIKLDGTAFFGGNSSIKNPISLARPVRLTTVNGLTGNSEALDYKTF
jgi:hypothetical protein